MLVMMIMSVMWNILTSLLILVAVHRGAVTAVVAEHDGKQANFLSLFTSRPFLIACLYPHPSTLPGEFSFFGKNKKNRKR